MAGSRLRIIAVTLSSQGAGSLQVLMRSNVHAIGAGTVTIDTDGTLQKLDNDAVIVSAGGVLPTGFLRSIGIDVET